MNDEANEGMSYWSMSKAGIEIVAGAHSNERQEVRVTRHLHRPAYGR